MSRKRRTYDIVKRGIDIVVAALALLLTAPLQLGVAGILLTIHGRPIFFRQDRPGREAQVFKLVKFRTMLPRDASRLSDQERLTRLGRLLRASSFDELPTLWNVLRGDMSLVGPRPLLVAYLPLYNAEQARRHEVRPGVTGLAQVNGRNSLSWEQKFRFDIEYVDNRSLKLDVQILLKTAGAVVGRRGISQDGHATMPEFNGPRKERNSDA